MKVKKYIKEVKNFPKMGVSFKDISPILAKPKVYDYVTDWFADSIGNADVIVSPDARGFLFGTIAAIKAKKPFVMIRKPGKLPGPTITESYDLEYGQNALEIQKNAISPGQKVVIIDDILATGGTVNAVIKLIEKEGGEVIKVLFIAELSFLNGKKTIKTNEIQSLVVY